MSPLFASRALKAPKVAEADALALNGRREARCCARADSTASLRRARTHTEFAPFPARTDAGWLW